MMRVDNHPLEGRGEQEERPRQEIRSLSPISVPDFCARFFDRFYARLAEGRSLDDALVTAQSDLAAAGAPAAAWAGLLVCPRFLSPISVPGFSTVLRDLAQTEGSFQKAVADGQLQGKGQHNAATAGALRCRRTPIGSPIISLRIVTRCPELLDRAGGLVSASRPMSPQAPH